MSRALVLALAVLAALASPVAGQGPGVARPGAYLYVLDLAGTPVGEFPSGLRMLKGTMEVVRKDGAPMLKASAASEFVIPLPQVLPETFTLEFELIPKACCNPQDLSFEGTPAINQGPASAHILWDSDGYLAVIGGGPSYETPMPEALKVGLPGMLTSVVAVFEGTTVKLYTNGRRLWTLTDRQFVRGRAVRVFLGGQDDGAQAVYLAGLRIGTGALVPGGVVAAGVPGPMPSGGAPSAGPTTATTSTGSTGTLTNPGSTVQAAGTGTVATTQPGPGTTTVPTTAPAPRTGSTTALPGPSRTWALYAPRATSIGAGVLVFWSPVANATAYRVWRMSSSADTAALAGTVSETDAVSQAMGAERAALDPDISTLSSDAKYWVEPVYARGITGEPGPVTGIGFDQVGPDARIYSVPNVRATVSGKMAVTLPDGRAVTGSKVTWSWDQPTPRAYVFYVTVQTIAGGANPIGLRMFSMYHSEVVRSSDPAPFAIMVNSSRTGPPFTLALPAGTQVRFCVSQVPIEERIRNGEGTDLSTPLFLTDFACVESVTPP